MQSIIWQENVYYHVKSEKDYCLLEGILLHLCTVIANYQATLKKQLSMGPSVFSKAAGDVLWVKLSGYPAWPARV